MATVAIFERARAWIVGGIKHGREQLARVIVREIGVRLLNRPWQVRSLAEIDADQRPGDAHEQSRGHALAADVADPERAPPVSERNEIEEIAADIARGGHRRPDVEAGFGGEFLYPGQKRPLNDRRARHFVVALTAQNDLLGHPAEGPPEIGEVRDWITQLLKQRGIQFMALERAKRMGVEADRAIELAHAVAHPADDVDKQGR